MKQITLKLFPNFNRPVVKLVNFHSFFAMIDTGAIYPVWMSGEERLERLGAKKIQNVIEFGGLGGMTKGGLYEIPAFQLGDLIYPNMKIIAHRSSFPVPLLLPATMFNNLIYEINNDGQGWPSAGAGAGCDCLRTPRPTASISPCQTTNPQSAISP